MTGVANGNCGLGWLLHPVPVAEFRSSYWQQRPLHVERGAPDHYAGLPGLDDIDGLVTGTAFAGAGSAPDARLVRTLSDGTLAERPFRTHPDGAPDVHDVYRRYDEGYTVVVNGVHARSPAVGALCRDLEADFEHPVGANLYLTPRGAQGFRPHVDSHDVVVQVHGTKEWRVGGTPSTPWPTAAAPGGPVDAVPDPVAYVLSPGDALYIPRGWAHEAVTQASSALHLTVGIHPFTWADLLAEALRQVVVDQPGLRRDLPRGHLGAPLAAAEVAALAAGVAAVTSAPVLDAARLALGSRLLRRHAAADGHFASLDAARDLTVNSVVARGFHGPCRLRDAGERLVADFPGNYVSVPPFLAPALKHAVRCPEFVVGSVPGDLDDAAKVDFVACLVSEGFLRVVH